MELPSRDRAGRRNIPASCIAVESRIPYAQHRNNPHLANRLVDARADDLASGYRLLHDGMDVPARLASVNRAQRCCGAHKLTTAPLRRRQRKRLLGSAVHYEPASSEFSAIGADWAWLTGITKHPSAAGKF
jgi:hypothetical protein